MTRDMVQDRAGRVWFATFGGVFRYDGQSFTNLSEEVGLARARVGFPCWKTGPATCGSARSYEARRGMTQVCATFTLKDGLVNDDVQCLFEDRAGNIWFGTQGGLSRYDGKSFTSFTAKDGLVNDAVYSLARRCRPAVDRHRRGRVLLSTGRPSPRWRTRVALPSGTSAPC